MGNTLKLSKPYDPMLMLSSRNVYWSTQQVSELMTLSRCMKEATQQAVQAAHNQGWVTNYLPLQKTGQGQLLQAA